MTTGFKENWIRGKRVSAISEIQCPGKINTIMKIPAQHCQIVSRAEEEELDHADIVYLQSYIHHIYKWYTTCQVFYKTINDTSVVNIKTGVAHVLNEMSEMV